MKRVAIDTETTGLSMWIGCRPFAVGMCWEDGTTKYWEWPVDPTTRMPMVDEKDKAEIQEICADQNLMKDFWNAKFDINMLWSIGIEVKGPIGEGTYMAKACDNLQLNYQLKPMAKRLVDIDDDDEKELQSAVVKCRRVAKKLGWKISTAKKDATKQDYWLPYTLCTLKPRLAAKHGLTKYKHVNKKYCITDTERTIVLCTYFRYGMKELGVEDIYNFEMDLLQEVTIPMERRGVVIDTKRMNKVRATCEAARDKALAKLVIASGKEDFNPNSPKQMVDLLYNGIGPGGLKLPVLMRTKGGKNSAPQPKTGAEAIEPYQHNYPLVETLFEFRANSKAISSFFDPYDRFARNTRYGMTLHTSWRQWGALTGRYTSTDPSLQIVPNPKTTNSKAAKYVVDVRQVYTPRRGHIWYCPDYSQVEVIIFADIANEPAMLQAIRDGVDIHEATANEIWGGEDNPKCLEAMKTAIITSELDKERNGEIFEDYDRDSVELEDRAEIILQAHDWKIGKAESSIGVKVYRKLAKSVTFTKIYGGGANCLMGWIGVSKLEATRILNQYDETFPDMQAAAKEIELQGKSDGFIINPYGRRLTVDRWYAYRAVNYMVQSAAADLMKRGMLKCARMLKEQCGNDARIVMTIHDELVFEMRHGTDTRRRLAKICQLMSDHEGVFSVPTPVDMDKVTERWSNKEAA